MRAGAVLLAGLGGLLVAQIVSAANVDVNEINNTCGDAVSWPDLMTFDQSPGSLNQPAGDWSDFSFVQTVYGNENFRAQMTPAGINFDLNLYSDVFIDEWTCQFLVGSANPGNGVTETVSADQDVSGGFNIQVQAASPGQVGTYALSYTISSKDAGVLGNEAGGDSGSAFLLAANGNYLGTLGRGNDFDDWYRFALGPGEETVIEVFPECISGRSNVDVDAVLYQQGPLGLEQVDVGINGECQTDRVEFCTLIPTQMYLDLDRFGGLPGGYRFSFVRFPSTCV